MTNDLYPEHARQAAVLEQAQAIGQFLDESGYILAEHRQFEGYTEEVLMPVVLPIEKILAAYFGIDLDKIEAEKRAMIDALRQAPQVCPRCAGTNGNHGMVHTRYGNGGGGKTPCPNTPIKATQDATLGTSA